jgi:molybdopterin-guanine dinucleotide biosynthesis protein A
MNTAIAILAGGQSQRMGQDKALLRLHGASLLERTAQLALQLSPQVLIVGRERPDDWPQALSAVRFIIEDTPHQGPLNGLLTALQQLPPTCSKVLLLACDLPLLKREALSWLIAQSQSTLEHGLIVVNAAQWEPLFSLYTRQVEPLVQAQLTQQRRSLHALIKAGDFAFIELPEELAASLTNVNTPEEWQALGVS